MATRIRRRNPPNVAEVQFGSLESQVRALKEAVDELAKQRNYEARIKSLETAVNQLREVRPHNGLKPYEGTMHTLEFLKTDDDFATRMAQEQQLADEQIEAAEVETFVVPDHIQAELDTQQDLPSAGSGGPFCRAPPIPEVVLPTAEEEAAEFEEEMRADLAMIESGEAVVTAEAATTIFEPAAGDEDPPDASNDRPYVTSFHGTPIFHGLPVNSDVDFSPDLRGMLMKELVQMCEKRGLVTPTRSKKKDLIEILNTSLREEYFGSNEEQE